MEVIEIDSLDAEPLQGRFKGGPDIFRLAIRSRWGLFQIS
jgi:hypothetical protein